MFASTSPWCHDCRVPKPLLDAGTIETLRASFETTYTSDVISASLGLEGEAALSRSDLSGVERLTRSTSPTDTWIRLFLLGLEVPVEQVRRAVGAETLTAAVQGGLLEDFGSDLTARLDIRPYGEAGGPDWWVVSDFGADIRPGRLDAEHVLGPGRAATTLAEATMRGGVRRALDIGTGCGVQALHLSRHADEVTATDLSTRALEMAATTAALSGLEWRLLEGSLLEPVEGELFDLVVCNPPFVVSPGLGVDADGFRYRDSGFAGDEVSRRLISGLPRLLTDGGSAQLLANWAITADEPWDERVSAWLDAEDCTMWVWQREVAEPGEYVSLWLRDGGELPGTSAWRRRYDAWLDWFAEAGILAVGMGLVNIRRASGTARSVWCEDVPQAVQQPCGPHISAWFERSAWLDSHATDDALFGAVFRAADGLVLTESSLLEPDGWQVALTQLRQSHGLRWELDADAAVAGLVAGCQDSVALSTLVEVMAGSLGHEPAALRGALRPVVADLVRRGFLVPVEGSR
jgi:methylase of polypeptide subunit release factors